MQGRVGMQPAFPSAAVPRMAPFMTDNTILPNSKSETRIATIPAPPLGHPLFALPMLETSERPAVHRKRSLEAAVQGYAVCHQRAFSKSAQEALRAGNALEQKV